jgi:hypothetical protein
MKSHEPLNGTWMLPKVCYLGRNHEYLHVGYIDELKIEPMAVTVTCEGYPVGPSFANAFQRSDLGE